MVLVWFFKVLAASWEQATFWVSNSHARWLAVQADLVFALPVGLNTLWSHVRIKRQQLFRPALFDNRHQRHASAAGGLHKLDLKIKNLPRSRHDGKARSGSAPFLISRVQDTRRAVDPDNPRFSLEGTKHQGHARQFHYMGRRLIATARQAQPDNPGWRQNAQRVEAFGRDIDVTRGCRRSDEKHRLRFDESDLAVAECGRGRHGSILGARGGNRNLRQFLSAESEEKFIQLRELFGHAGFRAFNGIVEGLFGRVAFMEGKQRLAVLFLKGDR